MEGLPASSTGNWTHCLGKAVSKPFKGALQMFPVEIATHKRAGMKNMLASWGFSVLQMQTCNVRYKAQCNVKLAQVSQLSMPSGF
jgi:hypothetical protein